MPLGPGGYARRSSAASCVENSSTSLAESFASSGGSTVHRSQSQHWVLALQHVQVDVCRPHVGRQLAVDKHFGMRLRLGNVVHVIFGITQLSLPLRVISAVGASRHVSVPDWHVAAPGGASQHDRRMARLRPCLPWRALTNAFTLMAVMLRCRGDH